MSIFSDPNVGNVPNPSQMDTVNNIRRDHNSNSYAVTHETEINTALDLIRAEVKKVVADDQIMTNSNNRRGGRNFGSGGKIVSSVNAKERMYKRAANKSEKDKAAAALQSVLAIGTAYHGSVFAMICDYGKVYSVSMTENVQIIKNAIAKAKAQNYSPRAYLEKFDAYVVDFQNTLLPVLKLAIAKGADPKFITWGVIMEGYKDMLKEVTQSSVSNKDANDHSLRFFYTRVFLYGVLLADATIIFRKVILSVLKLTSALKTVGVVLNLKPDITVESVRLQLEKHKAALLSAIPAQTALEEAVNNNEVANMSTSAASFFAAGISPYAIMQNSEYKQFARTKPDIKDACHKQIVWSFTIIRMVYNKISGNVYVYKGTNFSELRSQCFDMWRPMFVYARVMRQFMYPQQNMGFNSAIELDMLDATMLDKAADDFKMFGI